MTAVVIADCGCEIAEVPLWHQAERKLYWTDIPEGKLYRYDPDTDEYEQCYDGDVVGGYTIQEDGSLLLFMENGTVKRWTDGETETVIEEIPREVGSRFNDVIADPEGRVFAGTMPTEAQLGQLYRLDTDGTLTTVLDAVDLPNGLGFSPDRETLYFTESNTNTIYEFDYDVASGEITDQREFVRVPEDDGMPDGLTVDEEGYVWSAQFGGGCVIRYAPDGTEDSRHELPATNVTSLLFAGDDYEELYVTTADYESPPDEELAGAIFRIDPDVGGVPEFHSRI